MVALAGGPMHGHLLRDRCYEESEGVVEPGTGAIYPALRRLERYGYVSCIEEEIGPSPYMRRRYGLTGTGWLILEQETSRLKQVVALANSRLDAFVVSQQSWAEAINLLP